MENKDNKDNKDNMENNKKSVVGKGAYGIVERISDDVVRKRSLLTTITSHSICSITMNEAIFLSTYSSEYNSFIPQLIEPSNIVSNRVEITELESGTYIDMYMKDAGISLFELDVLLSLSERIKYIPYLLCKMSHILMWMRSVGVIHTDIKEGNICVKYDPLKEPYDWDVTLVDWGFVTLKSGIKPNMHGTFELMDPTFVTGCKTPDFSYDVYSLAITILCFLTKRHIKYEKIHELCRLYEDIIAGEKEYNRITFGKILTEYKMNSEIDWMLNDIGRDESEKFLHLLYEMMNPVENDRATPEYIYYSPYLDQVRGYYPLNDIDFTNVTVWKNIQKNSIIYGQSQTNTKLVMHIYDMMFYWLGDVRFHFIDKTPLNHVYKLFQNYTARLDKKGGIRIFDLERYIVASYYIILTIYNPVHSIVLTGFLSQSVRLIGLKEAIKDICGATSFKIYPSHESTEIVINNIIGNIKHHMYSKRKSFYKKTDNELEVIKENMII